MRLDLISRLPYYVREQIFSYFQLMIEYNQDNQDDQLEYYYYNDFYDEDGEITLTTPFGNLTVSWSGILIYQGGIDLTKPLKNIIVQDIELFFANSTRYSCKLHTYIKQCRPVLIINTTDGPIIFSSEDVHQPPNGICFTKDQEVLSIERTHYSMVNESYLFHLQYNNETIESNYLSKCISFDIFSNEKTINIPVKSGKKYNLFTGPNFDLTFDITKAISML